MSRYDNVNLEKGMYHESGKTFIQVLEKLDPSEQYRGTALEGLDAYQRQLKRFDIRVKGTGSDVVEKFFKTSQSAVLFPEYVSRAVKAGIEEIKIFSNIAATETDLDGTDYYSFSVESRGERKVYAGIALQTRDDLLKLHKRGRMLVASYEAVRHQKLDLLSVVLRQIGTQIERMHLEDAVNVLIDGDDSDNAARTIYASEKNRLIYEDLLMFWSSFEPYHLNTVLMNADSMTKMLSISQIQNTFKMDTDGIGEIIVPMGIKVLRTSAVPNGKIVGLDKKYALERIKVGDVTVDYDDLIDRKFERSAITTISGFAKIFTEASQVLEI